MQICYIDESGSAETLTVAHPSSTPVFVLVGVFVPTDRLRELNWEFLKLKKRYNPSLADGRLSDLIDSEVKGSDLRADIRSGNRNRRRRAMGLLDRTLTLLSVNGCQIVGRVVVKDPEAPLDDSQIYYAASAWVCRTFHAAAARRGKPGLVVLDSRTKVKNTPNSLGIVTQMFRTGGDLVPSLLEVPLFGHSNSHITLQIADLVASAIVFPAACASYASEYTWNHHAHPSYAQVRDAFGPRLKGLQFRYYDENRGHWVGGLHVTGTRGPLRVDKMLTAAPSPALGLEWVQPELHGTADP